MEKGGSQKSTYLHGLAVEPGGDLEGVGVLDDAGRDDAGSVRRPAVECLAEAPLAAPALDLPVAVGDVVADGVAQDVVQGVRLGHVGALLPDHHYQLALPVEALAFLRDGVHRNRIRRARKRRHGLVLSEESG